MKAVILAGGFGTRLSEETDSKPKPMVAIGGYPILWHIMKIFGAQGISEFIICLGYKGVSIKEYFYHFLLHNSDLTVSLENHKVSFRPSSASSEPWTIHLIDTGENTMTGGRLKRIGHLLDENETFFFTYGDGVADIDLPRLLKTHQDLQRDATVTVVRPPGRFGVLNIDKSTVTSFDEKPESDAWVNGGFFVLQKKALELISADNTVWEEEPMKALVLNQQLSAYQHRGFWQPMDTLRDVRLLNSLWATGKAPWKIWSN